MKHLALMNAAVRLATQVTTHAYSIRSADAMKHDPVILVANLNLHRATNTPIGASVHSLIADANGNESRVQEAIWYASDELRLFPSDGFLLYRPYQSDELHKVSVEWGAESFSEFTSKFVGEVIRAIEANP